VDRTQETLPQAKTNAKRISRGRICSSEDKDQLINYLYLLGINPQVEIPELAEATYDAILTQLRANRVRDLFTVNQPIEKLQFFYKWLRLGYTKEQICSFIYTYFVNNNLLKQE
jgi:hypothetical protein